MPDMTMTQSTVLMMGLLGFLILAAASVLVAFRLYAGREVRANHPASAGDGSPSVARFRLGAGGRVELTGPVGADRHTAAPLAVGGQVDRA